MNNPLIYLASPYSADEKVNFRRVCRLAARLMLDGHLVLSPIAHSHPIAQAGGLNTDFAFWRKFDERLIEMCAEFWIAKMTGWTASNGIHAEVLIAQHLQSLHVIR